MATLIADQNPIIRLKLFDNFSDFHTGLPSLACHSRYVCSGQGGIRTHGGVAPPTVFKTVPL